MSAITPEFLFDLESNMRLISVNAYTKLLAQQWWQRVAKKLPSMAKKERINWILETAQIERTIRSGGQVSFEDMVMQTQEYENTNAAGGLRLKKEQLEDLDGNGVQLASSWSAQMGAQAAYWPQKSVAEAILANPTTYDGKAFFATDHPVNPFNPDSATYRNVFTSTASGIYPGALPIDASVSLDTALANLQKAIAYIASIAMPNGVNPRNLRLSAIIVPPALMARAVQLTSAKFLAQAAGSAAGSGDVEAVISYMAFGVPIMAPELGSAFGGSDTSYYLAVEEIVSDQLGAFVYVEREPFSIVYHGPQTDADLAKAREFQWTTEGRNVVGPGHPFLLFRADAT